MTDSNTIIPSAPPPGLFFAGSDDEDEVEAEIMSLNAESPRIPHTAPQTPSTSRSSPLNQPLFLEDDDEDDDSMNLYEENENILPQKRQTVEDNSDIEIIEDPNLSRKKQKKLDSNAAASSSNTKEGPSSTKKRPGSTAADAQTPQVVDTFPPTYLGELVVPNAWSNVSGRGYVKVNDSIQIKRDQQESPNPGPSKAEASKSSNGKKKPDGKRQITLSNMLKPQPIKSNNSRKKKGDTIVRLVNNKGFGSSFRLIEWVLNIHWRFLRIWQIGDGHFVVDLQTTGKQYV